MKAATYLLIALILVTLQGCATLRGMAEDMQNLGRGVKQTIDEQGDGQR